MIKVNLKKIEIMRIVKRKVNKDNVKLGLILCFFMWVLVLVVMFGDMKG